MNLTLTNGINVGTEEEIVFGNTTTSDQSASEDSSLTDSERLLMIMINIFLLNACYSITRNLVFFRTIIGDEQNDCLPETSDSDQLSSPEAQTSTKVSYFVLEVLLAQVKVL